MTLWKSETLEAVKDRWLPEVEGGGMACRKSTGDFSGSEAVLYGVRSGYEPPCACQPLSHEYRKSDS